jgi:hypothetical protein
MIPQITLPLEQHGFFDPLKGLWIRSVIWNGIDWTNYETHDFKYVPHMEEGALLYSLLTGRDDLMVPARLELEELLSRVQPDGSIHGIPDGNGTAMYEYGTVLSCLGLGAQLFLEGRVEIGSRAYGAAERVFQYAARTFPPVSSEDHAMLLAGFCRVIEAERQVQGRARKSRLYEPLSAASGIEGSSLALAAWPNPMRDRIQILFRGPANATGLLRVIDATGRRCLTQILISDAQGRGQLIWDGVDDGGRRLPSGAYEAVLQTGEGRTATGFAIIR